MSYLGGRIRTATNTMRRHRERDRPMVYALGKGPHYAVARGARSPRASRVMRVALTRSSSWARLVALAIGAVSLGRAIVKSSPSYP